MPQMDGADNEKVSIPTAAAEAELPSTPSLALRRIPGFFRFDNAPPQATGLSLDIFARAAVLMSSIFLGPALLLLATEDAGCENEQDCDLRVYGMKPSSILSYIATTTGILSAVLMPVFGSIVDHTHHRKNLGIFTAIFLTVTKAIEIMVSRRTWLAITILQVFSGILYNAHILSTYAYTSELSKDPKEQTKYNTSYFLILYVSTLLFLGEVLVLAYFFNTQDVGTARISQILTTATCTIFFTWAWWGLFPDRPPSTQLQPGQSVLTAGFTKLFKTSWHINRHMPALRSLIWAIMFLESASATLVTVATTFMVHYLDMDTNMIGVVFLIVLVMGVPGAKIGEFVSLRFNPLVSAKAAAVFFIVVTSAASFTLTGPERSNLTVIFAVFWGIGLSWLHPQDTVLFIGLTPNHSQTEYMGIYLFSQQVLSWLPPLVFTILNEANVDMSIGLLSLCFFFFLGFICLSCIGRYDELKIVGNDPGKVAAQTELPEVS